METIKKQGIFYEAVDLFCGIGGLTKGLEMAGIPVMAGIDTDGSCEYSYTHNTNSRFIKYDVEKMSAKVLRQLYTDDQMIHILVGCAPCQPFSRLSGKYRLEGYRDDKWKLLYAFSRLVEELKPEIISMENVPDLEKKDVFRDFVNNLKRIGYYVNYNIVFCPDYEIPQNRKRLVLLASLKGEINLINPICKANEYLTVKDAISHLPPIKAGESDINDPIHRACRLSSINLRRIQQSVQGGTWDIWDDELKLKCHTKRTGSTYRSVYGRMSWNKPSPTITTQFYGYGNGRFGHPDQDRAISLREGALLQTFPKDYSFVGKDEKINHREIATHIGNAVPVKLGEAIGKSILKHIEIIEGKMLI